MLQATTECGWRRHRCWLRAGVPRPAWQTAMAESRTAEAAAGVQATGVLQAATSLAQMPR